jgi:hypothetical protein
MFRMTCVSYPQFTWFMYENITVPAVLLPDGGRRKSKFKPGDFYCITHSYFRLTVILIQSDIIRFVRFQFLTAASMNMRVFCDVAPFSLIGVDRRLRDAHCLHHQGDENSLPWRWRRYSPLKSQYTPTRLHGAISQNVGIFIIRYVLFLLSLFSSDSNQSLNFLSFLFLSSFSFHSRFHPPLSTSFISLLISYTFGSRCGSASIVSDYGLDYRVIRVRSPVEAKDFSCSLCVQTSSGSHPVSYPMGTGGPFPGGKARPGREADHSTHLVPRSMSRSYTPWRVVALLDFAFTSAFTFILLFALFSYFIKCLSSFTSYVQVPSFISSFLHPNTFVYSAGSREHSNK